MSLSELIYSGMTRVASVIVSNPTFDYVLGDKLSDPSYEVLACNHSGLLTDRNQVAEYFNARCRQVHHFFYALDPREQAASHLALAGTLNNRRALSTLTETLAQEGVATPVLNIADSKRGRFDEMAPQIVESAASAFHRLLAGDTPLTKGLLHQLIVYTRFIQAAILTLDQSRAHTFIVANDHSPGLVAYERIARHYGMKTVYLQHAEVTSNFPVLDFDLSVLRNERSKDIYEAVGKPRGEVIILPSGHSRLNPKNVGIVRRALVHANPRPTTIYPSGVSSIDAIAELVSLLEKNPRATNVSVKLHPADRDHARFHNIGIRTLHDTPNIPHLAICGNSSVVVELAATGNLVYQCFELDNIPSDYYGFVANGLAYTLPIRAAEWDFVLPEHARLNMRELARMDARVYSTSNAAHAVEARGILRSFFGEHNT